MSNYIIDLGLHNEMNIFVAGRRLQRLDEAKKKLDPNTAKGL